MGFTLEKIRALLALRVRAERRCAPVKQSAQVARQRVREQLNVLQRLDDVLGQLIDACDAKSVTDECPILAALEFDDRL
jgi:MerR family mercuric resistance operon transcriptional regulator